MKNRSIPPDLFEDEQLIEMDPLLFRTAMGLYFRADDHGRETVTEWRLKGALWPHRPDVTTETIRAHLMELDRIGFIGVYHDAAGAYFQVRRFPKQSHPAPSKYPDPPAELFDRFAGNPLEDFSAWGREGEGEGAGVREPAGGLRDLPPPPFCKLHMPGGSRGEDCRECADCRMANTHWRETRRAARRPATGPVFEEEGDQL